MKHGKKYLEAKKLVDTNKTYSIEEGVSLAKKASYSKFGGSMEIAIKTSADPKQANQMIRGTVSLPHGNGKTVKIAAFVSDDLIESTRNAGADMADNTNLIKDIESGKIDFDVLLTTPDMIKDLAKVAKILGPKGLMPAPKAGTVTTDISSTISEIKKGRIEYKMDKTGNIHLGIGKLSFKDDQLVENIKAICKYIEEHKPSAIKTKLFKKITISATMGIGVNIES